jgi:hypothetical protein
LNFNDLSGSQDENSYVRKPTYEMVENEMTRITKAQLIGSIVAVLAIAGGTLLAPAANAATKSITCYKGTTSKVVKAAAPKCPTGYTTKKPVAVKPPVTTSSKVLTLNATYTGKIAMLWTDSSVSATSVTATGSGTTLGLTQLTGKGSSSPSSQCDTINGVGTISDGTNTLTASFDPSAQGCAKAGAAPTTVSISGNAVISGGTGKYAGATGTLKFTGSFPVTSTAAGTNESGALTLTITGSFNTK